jgi:hypothetical protein
VVRPGLVEAFCSAVLILDDEQTEATENESREEEKADEEKSHELPFF